MGGVIEDEGSGGVDGRGAGFGVGVWYSAYIARQSANVVEVSIATGEGLRVPACNCRVSNFWAISSPPILATCSVSCWSLDAGLDSDMYERKRIETKVVVRLCELFRDSAHDFFRLRLPNATSYFCGV